MLEPEASGKKKKSTTRVAEESYIDRPAPALEVRRETDEQRSETRCACGKHTPERHSVRTLLRSVHVGTGRATRHEDPGAEESGKETDGHQPTVVGSNCSRNLEYDEHGKHKDVDGHAVNWA